MYASHRYMHRLLMFVAHGHGARVSPRTPMDPAFPGLRCTVGPVALGRHGPVARTLIDIYDVYTCVYCIHMCIYILYYICILYIYVIIYDMIWYDMCNLYVCNEIWFTQVLKLSYIVCKVGTIKDIQANMGVSPVPIIFNAGPWQNTEEILILLRMIVPKTTKLQNGF
jgi:hypothetical protein